MAMMNILQMKVGVLLPYETKNKKRFVIFYFCKKTIRKIHFREPETSVLENQKRLVD